MFIEFGPSSFVLVNIAYIVPLIALGVKKVGSGTKTSLSSIEKYLILYTIWGVMIGLLYIKNSSLSDFVKLVIPTLSYLIFRRTIGTARQYISGIKWLLIGFSFPVFWSLYQISQRQGRISVDYFTGVERFTGAYNQIHSMGHNMGFILMLLVILFTILKNRKWNNCIKNTWPFTFFLFLVGSSAMYCLLHSHVRTVYVGLIVFSGCIAWMKGKKYFLFFVLLIFLFSFSQVDKIRLVFQDVVDAAEGKAAIESAGSGRGLIWSEKFRVFGERSIDQKITGIGLSGQIKEQRALSAANIQTEFDSHNEYIQIVMEFGIVGLFFLTMLYYKIWKQIDRLCKNERIIFQSFLISVLIMNFVSNSYISRFGLTQLFFMIILYVDLPGITRKTSTDK